jgi:hypothetical protein
MVTGTPSHSELAVILIDRRRSHQDCIAEGTQPMGMLQVGLTRYPVGLSILSGDAAIKALGQVTDNERPIGRKRAKQWLKEFPHLRRF